MPPGTDILQERFNTVMQVVHAPVMEIPKPWRRFPVTGDQLPIVWQAQPRSRAPCFPQGPRFLCFGTPQGGVAHQVAQEGVLPLFCLGAQGAGTPRGNAAAVCRAGGASPAQQAPSCLPQKAVHRGLLQLFDPPPPVGQQGAIEHGCGNPVSPGREVRRVAWTESIVFKKSILKPFGTHPAVQHGVQEPVLRSIKKRTQRTAIRDGAALVQHHMIINMHHIPRYHAGC